MYDDMTAAALREEVAALKERHEEARRQLNYAQTALANRVLRDAQDLVKQLTPDEIEAVEEALRARTQRGGRGGR